MRWRFVDKVTALEPWQQIAGRKAVSLEEYYLLQPLGREGVLPESLLIECCVELVRWLITASSSFEWAALLGGIEEFVFERPARMGDLLQFDVRVIERSERELSADCRVNSEAVAVASGRLAFALVPLHKLSTRGELEGLWQELYDTA